MSSSPIDPEHLPSRAVVVNKMVIELSGLMQSLSLGRLERNDLQKFIWGAEVAVVAEWYSVVDDDNARVKPQLWKTEFVQRSKNIIDADSDEENELNNSAHVLTSFKTRNIMKSTQVVLGEEPRNLNNSQVTLEFMYCPPRVEDHDHYGHRVYRTFPHIL
ncbi:hypothetical protein TNCV_4297111 [Trichonephila clavipes]|nr:hypothetical protein TNCV_4297111 [Trichonephila clavipes]